MEVRRGKEERKPAWLKVRLPGGDSFTRTRSIVSSHGLHTICASGRCPNMAECWSRGTATFMIAGDICTRSCKFCSTATGHPLPLDPSEPSRVADSIRRMELRHAVITSVDRDDLPDMGAAHWADTIRKIKETSPGITVEALIPDFRGKRALVDMVIDARPDIISHNMETVERLTPYIRSAASYKVSLEVLKYVASGGMVAKTGIMVGLGEEEGEVHGLMDDVLSAGVSVLTIGQYLRPTKANIPVSAYIHPSVFAAYKEVALSKGFTAVESGPLVRSSYYAEKHV
ncbi:MAG: lipoyl synthase [Tannerellaceae bacterium]|nr:lipoyl synthase [Tannerellaceae bacterium]